MADLYIVPTQRAVAHWEQTTTLDGRAYLLRFDWHQRWGRWTLSMYTENGDALIEGKALTVGPDLLKHVHHDERVPTGGLFVMDKNGSGNEPGFDDLYKDGPFTLLYITAS